MADEDILDSLTNPEEVRKAELESSRPQSMPAFTEIVCDIANDELRIFEGSSDYGDYQAVNLRLQNIQVIRCVEGKIFSDDEYNLELRVPKKANSNSPIALMVASAVKVDPKMNTIRAFPGKKKVHFKETVHTWKMREKVTDEFGEDVVDDNGKKVYQDRPVNTRYYAVVGIGGSPNVKAAAAKATVTDEAKAAAMVLVKNAGTDGMTESDFNKAAMKDKVLKDMTDILMDGSLIAEMVADGTVLRDGDIIVAV